MTQNSAALRVAVIGAGTMASNHVRVLSGLDGVQVAAVIDPDLGRAEALAQTAGAAFGASLNDLPRDLGAAVIASSSSTHIGVALDLIGRGLPCLVEKPLAITRADCEAIADAAERAGLPLAVGHVERFNPAFEVARRTLGEEAIRAIDGRRFNPGSARITDTDVVIDLMVHDIDAVLTLFGATPASIQASGMSVASSGLADHVGAVMAFGGGAVATLSASRIAYSRVREVQILTETRMITLDFLNQAVSVTTPAGTEPVTVEKGQSLATELGRFTTGIRAGSLDVGVSARDAIRTLDAVWKIQTAVYGKAAP